MGEGSTALSHLRLEHCDLIKSWRRNRFPHKALVKAPKRFGKIALPFGPI
jgi:hypothetical protein